MCAPFSILSFNNRQLSDKIAGAAIRGFYYNYEILGKILKMTINNTNNKVNNNTDAVDGRIKRRRKRVLVLASLTILFFVLVTAQIAFNALDYIKPTDVAVTLFLYLFSSITFLGFTVLLIALIRNIMKLSQEKRQGKVGARFKWRLVVSSISLSLLPVLFMFIVMSGMINRSIEKWFGIAGQEVLSSSQQVVDTYLGSMRESLSRDAEAMMRRLVDSQEARADSLLISNIRDLQLISAELYKQDGQVISKVSPDYDDESNRELREALIVARAKIIEGKHWNDVVNNGLRPVYVISLAVIPPPSSITPVDYKVYSGLILVRKVPVDTSAMIDKIARYIDRYEQLRLKSKIVRNSAFVTLMFFTVTVMFVIFWLTLNIARSIADPVQKLAIAIDGIKKGDLSYRADVVSDDEFGALALSFNEMADELAESRSRIEQATAELVEAQRNAAWSEVARRMAHEIKNPLTPIRLSAERLRKKFLGGGTNPLSTPNPTRKKLNDAEIELLDECTAMIDTEVTTLQRMVDEFSQFAREPNAVLKITSINDVVEKTVKLYYDRLNGIKLDCRTDFSVPSIALDEEQVKRLLVNLIDNAAEALSKYRNGKQDKNSQEKRIIVETRNNPNKNIVELIVMDNGPGIDPTNHGRIFEPNYSTRKRGTGLGLAIVHRIVMQHHGHIHITDNAPRGAKFIVEFPIS